MELARICTQEKGTERLHESTGVDTRGSKGEKEAKNHIKKNHREREEQGRMDGLEWGQNGSGGKGELG